jgi:hypothetical protein
MILIFSMVGFIVEDAHGSSRLLFVSVVAGTKFSANDDFDDDDTSGDDGDHDKPGEGVHLGSSLPLSYSRDNNRGYIHTVNIP